MKAARGFALIALLAGGVAATAAEPAFHASFDGDLAGGEAAGADITFGPGIVGQAAVIGAQGKNEFRAVYDARGAISAEEGAVSLWVKPLDWDAQDPHHQIFFSATGEDSVLHLYRYNDVGAQSGYSRKLLFLYGPSRRGADGNWRWTIASSDAARDWEAGRWHHIACTWDAETMILYLDGRVADTREVAAPAATAFGTFGVGGAYSWQNTGGTSLIDELKVFRAPLTAAEVYAEWEAYRPATAAVEGEQTDFGVDYIYTDIEGATLHLGLRQPYPLLRGEAITAHVRLLGADDALALQRSFSEAEYAYEVALPIADVQPGDYEVDVRFVAADETALGEYQAPYTKYPPGPAPWDGTTAGLTEGVPAPWTEVVADGNTVACWGREYRFDDSPLPTQIVSQESLLLAAPMRLSGEIEGEAAVCRGAEVAWERRTGPEVACSAVAAIGPLSVRSDCSVEYDGFIWLDITLEPPAPTEVSRLVIDIPLRREAATLRNLGRYRLEGTGAAPESGAYWKDLSERPIFWLGNEAVGLQWFAETLEGWHVVDFARTLEVIAEEDRVVARLHVIDTPTVLDTPRTISFGIQATPVRPKPEDWRQWRLRPWRGPRPEFNIRPWFTEWTDLFNYPRPPHVVAERIDERERYTAEGARVLSYLSLTHTTPYSPEFRYYGEGWRRTPQRRVLTNTALDPQTRIWANYVICAEDASYRDFYLSMLDEAIREFDITGGLYFDQARAEMCMNARHGCGWVDPEGNEHATLNILGTRELAKRIYVMMKSYSPDALIAHHMSGEITMPVNAFSDMLIDGENLTGAVGLAGNYYDALPLDTFRAEYMPHQWGTIPALLPQHARSASILKGREEELYFYESPEAQKPIEHLLGLVMVHDALIWPAWEVRPNALWAAMDEFGWDDEIEFVPYWAEDERVRVLGPDAEGAVVSAFLRPGRAMLVPLNNTDEDVVLRVRPALDALATGTGEVVLTDAYHGESFVMREGVAEVPMPARGFRMLITPR